MANATFLKLAYTGTGARYPGLSNPPLGPQKDVTGFFRNAVELQFTVDPAVDLNTLKARQWSGTECIWAKKNGPYFGTPWTKLSGGPGSGADDPDTLLVLKAAGSLKYYDSPGIVAGKYANCSGLYVVMNFTGWIDQAASSGAPAQKASDVAAWTSIISLANPSWDKPNAALSWQWVATSTAKTGWADTNTPPSI
jgi:hypothetical protein